MNWDWFPPEDFSCQTCGMDTEDFDLVAHPELEEYLATGHCSWDCQRDGLLGQKVPVVRPMYDLLVRVFGNAVDGSWLDVIANRTVCGAWLDIKAIDEIQIGSIVEGVDQCTEPVTLKWPFTERDVEAAEEITEERAEEIWMATHGCDTCRTLHDGFKEVVKEKFTKGNWEGQVHPDCPECGGEGTII